MTTNAKVIVWMSQHFPTANQRAELERLFPGHRLTMDANPFDGAGDIIRRFHDMGGDELVVVAPLAVVRAIVRRGIHPLWAEMQHVAADDPRAEVTINNRHYRFVRFHRVTDIQVVTHDPTTGEATNEQATQEVVKSRKGRRKRPRSQGVEGSQEGQGADHTSDGRAPVGEGA